MGARTDGSTRPRLRLVFVTARYRPSTGGTEMHTYELGRRLVDAGHEVTVLTTDLTGELAPNELIDGIEVVRLPAWPRSKDYYIAPRVYSAIRSGGWDIVHCHGYHTMLAPLAMFAARRARIPYVVTFHSGGHSSPLRTRFRALQRQLLRPLLSRASRLIGVSEFERDLFQATLRLPEELFAVIPNGANLTSEPQDAGVPVDKNLIISMGRLERYKGHDRVLTALPYVIDERPDARVTFLGSGPFEAELRRLATRLGCADRVEFCAFESDDRAGLASLLRRAGVIALLSEYEAHSVAAIEALFLHRPVVVSDRSGLHELVAKRLATGVPVDASERDIARAILDQLRSPLIPAHLKLPTWEDVTTAILELYCSILDERDRFT